ncbi:MAG: hypothetical protein HRT86_05210 [Ilumatobacteraceae bacterium]|nr:hypothetical protein [Ilumatobacteraceae bacterium]
MMSGIFPNPDRVVTRTAARPGLEPPQSRRDNATDGGRGNDFARRCRPGADTDTAALDRRSPTAKPSGGHIVADQVRLVPLDRFVAESHQAK